MMDDLLQEMIDPAPVHHDAPRRRRLWSTVAIVGLAAVGATTLTTSAHLHRQRRDVRDHRERHRRPGRSATTVPFAFAPQNLAPGASTFAPLQVQSNGSLALRYADLVLRHDRRRTPWPNPDLDPPAAAGDLRDVLELRVYARPADELHGDRRRRRDPAQRRGHGRQLAGATVTPLVGDSCHRARRPATATSTAARRRASGSASGSTSRSTADNDVPGRRGDARPDVQRRADRQQPEPR